MSSLPHRRNAGTRRARLALLIAGLAASTTALVSTEAWSQTGGVSGTTSLAAGDFFLGVQKVEGVNLTPADQARFLDRASCECQRTVWLRALLFPASAVKAASVPATASVSMWLGNSCNSVTGLPNCSRIGNSIPFSQFKLSGMQTPTTVDVLAVPHGVIGVSTGGTTGSGGAGGQGGTSGSGGTSGPVDSGPCATMITQTVWLLVETTPGLFDIASASLPLIVDGSLPPSPANVKVEPANEALSVSWTAVDQTSTSDLAGYQLFCTRADQFKVFDDGTFTTSVDTCHADLTDLSPTAITDRNTHFLCSDLLSTSTTSHRIKILENGIPYVVGVAAVDLRGNASLISPSRPISPELTYDFYHAYRNGVPQGEATGGYCAVSGSTSTKDLGAVALTGGIVAAVAAGTRRRRARRRGP